MPVWRQKVGRTMNLDLKTKDNENLVAFFPAALEEIRNTIKELKIIVDNSSTSDKNKRELVLANKKYLASLTQIVDFGEGAFELLKHHKTKITDDSAILFILRGFAIYINNREREYERVRRTIQNERFFYTDNGKIVLSKMCNDAKKGMPDLSYIYDEAYSQKALINDSVDSTKKFYQAVDWIIDTVKASDPKTMLKNKQHAITDLLLITHFVNKELKLMRALSSQALARNGKDLKLYQGFFTNYNTAMRRIYLDCWEFKTRNNL